MQKWSLTPELEKEIVRRLAAAFQPEAIFLFGSQAWGSPEAGSDLDFMVIVSGEREPPLERARRAQRSLRGVLAPVDVLVKTRDDFDRYRQVHASLEAQVFEKGKLLYGSKTRPGEAVAGKGST